MKSLLAGLAAAIGLGALLERRRRRRAGQLESSPANELRAKLAEVDELAGEPADEGPADDASSASDVDARRREVHDRAREALDGLR